MAKKQSAAKKQIGNNIALDAKQIEQFHRRVEECLNRHTGQKITLRFNQTLEGTSHHKEAWKTASLKDNVVFNMVTEGDYVLVATGKSTHSSVAVRLKSSAPVGKYQSWITWSDTWVKQTPELFKLIGFSLGFYSGPASSNRDVRWKIVRAEWDDPQSRGGESAQPHWHIDPDVLDQSKNLRAFGEDTASVFTEDTADPPVESLAVPDVMLPTTSLPQPSDTDLMDANVSMKHMHLGMGGWLHKRDKMPGSCWQYPLDDVKLDGCVGWIEHTLAYMSAEMKKLRVGETTNPEQVIIEDL